MTVRTRKHLHHTPAQAHKTGKRREPFDYVIYFFTVATPLFEIPQAITIYANHSAKDVSVWTWSFFVIDNLVWIVYAVKQKLTPLLITSILYLIIEIAIVAGIIHYA